MGLNCHWKFFMRLIQKKKEKKIIWSYITGSRKVQTMRRDRFFGS